MTLYDYVAQGLGFFACALVIVAFANKSDQNFKIIAMCGTLLFTIHFFMIGAIAGSIVAGLNTTRTFFSIKFHNSNFVMIGFLSIYPVVAFLIYESPSDILPIFSGMGTTFALYKLSGIKLRLCTFGVELSWLAYSGIVKSLGGIATSIFVLTSNAATIYRLVRDKKKEQVT